MIRFFKLSVFITTISFQSSIIDGFSIIRPPSSTLHRQLPVCSDLSMAISSTHEAPVSSDPITIRNVAVVGHSHSGKSTLVEWMLYDEKMINKRPTTGESFLDFDPQEAARHSSVFSHFARVPHGNHLIEIADTPWGDFPSDALASLDGADSAMIVISAADGVQTGTKQAFDHCNTNGIKSLLVLSKMDRPFLQLDSILNDLESSLGVKPVPIQVPLYDDQGSFSGVNSLIVLDDHGLPQKNNLLGDADFEMAWTELEEAVAVADDDLLIEYLENSKLSDDQVLSGLRKGVIAGKILPLVYTAAEKDLGIVEAMDAIVTSLPNPIEMRDEAIRAACENEMGKCGLIGGIEAGFTARVLHTTVDSYGSLSILRVISNSCDNEAASESGDKQYHSLPSEAVIMRTGDKIKMPSALTTFALCGKERLTLSDHSHIVPGAIIAVPKMPENIRTNDIITVPSAVKEEESEIELEVAMNLLTPLSRVSQDQPLMASAIVSLPDSGGNSSKGKGKSSASDDKLSSALAALAREDLSLQVEHEATSGGLLLRCMSGDHLRLVTLRLKERYGIDVELGRPPVPYRETLGKAVENMEGRHKKQSGGSGQFGLCYINMEPLEEGAGIEFESKIKGGVISKTFINSVEKGVREQLQSGGPLAGYPVTDVRVTLIDGKMHSVDSKDIAFQSAGKLAVKAALAKGGTKLLHPMEKVTFTVSERFQGDINTLVTRGNGYVTSTNPLSSDSGDSNLLSIEAIIPTSSLAQLSDGLQASTAGEGKYTSVYSHYQPVPESEVKDIVASRLANNSDKLSP